MRCPRLSPAFVAAAVAVGSSAAGQTAPSPYDVTTYPVIVTEPGMASVVVEKKTWGDGLAFEIARPARPAAGAAKAPAVVFINGVGGKLNEWEIYRSWARLTASRGLAGVTFEMKSPASPAGVKAFLAHLSKNADALGLDLGRLASWACSANVTAALPIVMAGDPVAFRAAVFYYGTGEAAALSQVTPVYWVLAGRDGEGLVSGQKALFERATREKAPWTMTVAPDLPHAFDAVEDTPHSRQVVRETLAFLEASLAAPGPAREVPLAKQATAFVYANEPARAAEVYRKILAANPNDRDALRFLGLALVRAGKPEEAIPELRRAIALGEKGAGVHQTLGEALLKTGKPAEAAAELGQAVSLGAKYPPVLYNLACAQALAGNRDAAFERLNEVAALGWSGLSQNMERDEDLAGLRSDPRWAALLAKVHAAAGTR